MIATHKVIKHELNTKFTEPYVGQEVFAIDVIDDDTLWCKTEDGNELEFTLDELENINVFI